MYLHLMQFSVTTKVIVFLGQEATVAHGARAARYCAMPAVRG
jgi:hypothetical protein